MTGRMWRWAAILIVIAGVLLGVSIHAIVVWHQSSGDPYQTITLGQLVGFMFAALALIVAATILVTGYRRRRDRRRMARARTRGTTLL